MLSKEEQAEKYADIEHYVNCGTSRYQGFLAGYTARDEEDRWVPVSEGLPDMPNDYSGNKASNPVLVWNGEDIYKAYCEAIRPDFVTIIWDFSDVMEDKNHSRDPIKEYSGKSVTHWQPLPSKPIEK